MSVELLRNAFVLPTRSVAADFKWQPPKSLKPSQNISVTGHKATLKQQAKTARISRAAI